MCSPSSSLIRLVWGSNGSQMTEGGEHTLPKAKYHPGGCMCGCSIEDWEAWGGYHMVSFIWGFIGSWGESEGLPGEGHFLSLILELCDAGEWVFRRSKIVLRYEFLIKLIEKSVKLVKFRFFLDRFAAIALFWKRFGLNWSTWKYRIVGFLHKNCSKESFWTNLGFICCTRSVF